MISSEFDKNHIQNRYHTVEVENGVNYCFVSFPDGSEVSLMIDPAMRLYELFEGENIV